MNALNAEEEELGSVLDGIDDEILSCLATLNDKKNEGRLQVEKPLAALMIDGSGETLHPADLDMTFTVKDEFAEIASMSASEMASVEADLHGITNNMSTLNVQQTPPDLLQLGLELIKLPPEKTAAYYRALRACPDQVSNERKMIFLQSVNNNPELAAAKIASYWELRLELFGPERCFLPMTLNGAMKDEATHLIKRHVAQLLPVKDTAGRAIVFVDPSRRDFVKYSPEQELMAGWYLLEVAMEDPEVRKHGMVFIYDASSVQQKHFSRKFAIWKPRIGAVFPLHYRAIHVCYPNFIVNFVVNPIVKLLIGREFRRRVQLHYGSPTEVIHGLKGFCLPSDRLPAGIGGDLTLDMEKWVSDRRVFEEVRSDPRLALELQQNILPDGPALKRQRCETTQPISQEVVPATDHHVAPLNAQQKRKGGESVEKKKKGRGRPSDPRMAKAVKARLLDPDLSLQGALEKGGFVFVSANNNGPLVDDDNITVVQRRNQLSRRIRQTKAKMEQEQEENQCAGDPVDASTQAACIGQTTNTVPLVRKRTDSFDEAISKIALDGFDSS